jgi:pectin methylesterase-like acyl-CoA thioesterase
MKTFTTLLILFCIVSLSAFATIRTVSNDPQNPAQFNTIQAAVNAAVVGDTIYVNASSTTYSENVSVTKRLVLIGGGYKSPLQLNYKT